MIRTGRVAVNGRTAVLGNRVDPHADTVSVDGVPVPVHPGLRHLALNKPRGVTTTLSDPHATRTLRDLIPAGARIFPVGRLDRDSEGLLLLTNDGSLAHRLQHPRYGVEKEYLVEVHGSIPRAAIKRLTDGLELEDGTARALRASAVQRAPARSALSVVMGEGRKREVRRMMAAVGYPAQRLVRVRYGPVRLGDLRPGAVRQLSREETMELYRSAGLSQAVPGGRVGKRDGR